MKRQKRVTIKDIAQHLGISQSTVSRVVTNNLKAQVSPATRQRVLETASAMGYRPNLLARAVATRKSGILGLLTHAIFEPVYASYVQGITMEAHWHGYQVMLGLATTARSKDLLDDQRVQIRQMISQGVDGLLIHVRGGADKSSLIADEVRDAVSAVTFSQAVEGVSGVVLDRAAGAYAAAEHLIRLGHRRIGFVRVSWSPSVAWEGYLRAMQAHGLTPERFILDDVTLETGYRMGRQMGRTSDRPTALFCWGDLLAIGVCRGLQEVGVRVPEDVAVVGFDGIEIGAYCTPPLTTVAQPVEEVCREAVQLLIDQLNGEREVRQVVVQPHLIVRQSCGTVCDSAAGLECYQPSYAGPTVVNLQGGAS